MDMDTQETYGAEYHSILRVAAVEEQREDVIRIQIPRGALLAVYSALDDYVKEYGDTGHVYALRNKLGELSL